MNNIYQKVINQTEIKIPQHWKKINYDLAFGGAFYAYVDADAIGLKLTIDNYNLIIKAGHGY